MSQGYVECLDHGFRCTYHMTSNWDLLIDFKKMMGEKSYWAITIPLMSREVGQLKLQHMMG